MRNKKGGPGVFKLAGPLAPIMARTDVMVAQDYSPGSPAHSDLTKEVNAFMTTPPKKARVSFTGRHNGRPTAPPFASVESFDEDAKPIQKYEIDLQRVRKHERITSSFTDHNVMLQKSHERDLERAERAH